MITHEHNLRNVMIYYTLSYKTVSIEIIIKFVLIYTTNAFSNRINIILSYCV